MIRLTPTFRRLATLSAKTKSGKSKKAPYNPDGDVDIKSTVDRNLIEILRPNPPRPPRTDAERKRLRALMQRYSALKRTHYLEMEGRLREFLRAKWAAIDALPHFRRVEALTTEPTPFPMNRPLFTDTPPIKNFNPGDLAKH